MIKTDLHVHITYSYDASINPKTLVNQLCTHQSIKAVAVTDHNTVRGYHKVRELSSSYKDDVPVIPGIEIRTMSGDLIVLSVTELPPTPWTVENVIDFARENNGLTILPHPYRNYDVDAIEILNGTTSHVLNKMAEKLTKSMRLSGVASGDAHTVDELWTVYTEVQSSTQSADYVLEAIKKGLVKVGSTGKSIHF